MTDLFLRFTVITQALRLCACSTTPHASDIEATSPARAVEPERVLGDAKAQNNINTAALAVIKNGAVVWCRHCRRGWNALGIAAKVDTLRLLAPDSPEWHGDVARRMRAQ